MTTSKGLVFDIKHFAVHDGQGIRTTIFLKGCNLRCKWCQNPEGLELKRSVIYLPSKCMHCGRCAQVAHDDQLEWINQNPVLHRERIDTFDEVINTCPTGALRYDSQYYDVEGLIKEIKKDSVFHQNGGGVTFSGGEPLLQYEYLLEVLKECKKLGIHTAIETALNVPLEHLQIISPYIDQFFTDFKVYDEVTFKDVTNGNINRVKENIKYLLNTVGEKVTIRTPLIPNITDRDENIRNISQWISLKYPGVKYELLNYNELAPSKYEMVGKEYPLGSLKKLKQERYTQLQQIAMQSGNIHLIK